MAWFYPADAFEAESIGVREALSWVMERGDQRVIIETDSLATVEAVNGDGENLLEVGLVIEQCRLLLKSFPGVEVVYVRRQANGLAHALAKFPCNSNCQNVFTSPPDHLLEIIRSDISF